MMPGDRSGGKRGRSAGALSTGSVVEPVFLETTPPRLDPLDSSVRAQRHAPLDTQRGKAPREPVRIAGFVFRRVHPADDAYVRAGERRLDRQTLRGGFSIP